ncbi:L,D-transpeptidase family protein [Sphingomonas sabuli]|uniref:L,D-transpeptidase family protein n=1 Tax=Sphingomonas sabuli TaxID=2764186 RepID=A0A7G9L5H6_9SPHN|nr:L,D-transpeptidase family protein [Sphingomonas sabuli]QNM83875.1 L,D-transpeptidase family protein [Sphingomonas sabuli]
MKALALILSAAALAMSADAAYAQAFPRGDEPIAVPRNVRQGIDFVYVDPDLSTVAQRRQRPTNWLLRTIGFDWGTREAPSRMFADLANGLRAYQASWGRLPQVKVPVGPTLKKGMSGRRVEVLRTRLGLSPAGGYNDEVVNIVSAYQRVHGLGAADGIAGRDTISSLNRGADHYIRRIAINMERAFRLPKTGKFDRYVVVDSGAAEVYLFDRDRVADGMRAVVGSPKTKTPMMAVLLRDALANPYWNVPPELVRSLTAKRIGKEGLSYLKNYHYEVLSDWGNNATLMDPKAVNWKAIASGQKQPTIRVRQKPGPWNSMGEMKFEMPNDYGIYLHDTPHKELFSASDRWVSNGCVRLEDYKRFATWLFGGVPGNGVVNEQRFEVPRPVPVFMTYMTVAPKGNGVVFRGDPYGFDAQAMDQMFGPARQMASMD